jgi:peptide/nickel transport system ATP-binding protein
MTTLDCLEINALSVKCNNYFLVENISFHAKRGELTALTGPSGSGKTTIINAIAGLTMPNLQAAGYICFNDHTQPVARTTFGRPGYSVVFQGPLNSLNPIFTAGRYLNEVLIAVSQKIPGPNNCDLINEVLNEVGLSSKITKLLPAQMSGGERQRVLVAGVLLSRPQVILADEPTASLDIISKNEILNILYNIAHHHNIPVLVATHETNLIAKYANNFIALESFPNLCSNYKKSILSKLHSSTKSKQTNILASDLRIKIEGVKKSINGKAILKNVSFELMTGDVLGLAGRSGCGKSTLARCITGLLPPDSGTIKFKNNSGLWASITVPNPSIQMIFQEPYASFDPHLSLVQSISYAMTYAGLKRTRQDITQKALQSLQEVGIDFKTASRKPTDVSGGECQRAAIIRALLCQPYFLIADEVTSALDSESGFNVMAALYKAVEKSDLTIIIISHNVSLLANFCSKLAFLDQGEIVEFGETKEIITHSKTSLAREFIKIGLS